MPDKHNKYTTLPPVLAIYYGNIYKCVNETCDLATAMQNQVTLDKIWSWPQDNNSSAGEQLWDFIEDQWSISALQKTNEDIKDYIEKHIRKCNPEETVEAMAKSLKQDSTLQRLLSQQQLLLQDIKLHMRETKRLINAIAKIDSSESIFEFAEQPDKTTTLQPTTGVQKDLAKTLGLLEHSLDDSLDEVRLINTIPDSVKTKTLPELSVTNCT